MPKLRRHEEFLAERLRDREFTRSYLEVMISGEDGGQSLSPFEAIKEVVQGGGAASFAALVGKSEWQVLRFIARRTPPSQKTLNLWLHPIGLITERKVVHHLRRVKPRVLRKTRIKLGKRKNTKSFKSKTR